jgi:mono/diheme cytochrome c family protein
MLRMLLGLALVAGPVVASPVVAAPVVPGLDNKHPLSPRQVGDLLIGELRCVACHVREPGQGLAERAAPDLSDVGARVSPDFLRRFIASPSTVQKSTTMPDVLADQSPQRRSEIADALTHFLVAQSAHAFQSGAVAAQDAAEGQKLFHGVGCIACHSPRDAAGHETIPEAGVSLAHVAAKYSVSSLGAFLFRPSQSRPSGRMPDMKLTGAEAKAIAAYLLIGIAPPEVQPLQPRADRVAAGKAYFQEFNCAACHALKDMKAAPPAGRLKTMDPDRGCLSPTAGKHPSFHLDDAQVRAIRAAMAAKAEPVSDRARIDLTLTAFNCIACHVRDGYGGMSEARNALFQTDEKNLGEDARIPPPLTKVGAKLQTVWMQKVLFDGETIRPYMLTRMPRFGEANLGPLPELFARVDAVKPVEYELPGRAREKTLRAAGYELLGDKGLNCITCHTFNGKASAGFKGLDLMTSYQRLRPGWFESYLRNPAAYRPGTVMPTYWPGGKAVQTQILDGNTDAQIEAIWYYLSLGTSARDPSGLQRKDSKLYVTDATRTYRGRSGIAGFRGIAVGFPSGLSYAFNAETGTLSGLWHGDFISVSRSGQGSGGFNPADRAVTLAQDVSFCELADDKAPWPLRPTMTKEAPVNPDPLYPHNHGYQFKGYYLDAASIPTFMYRSGDVGIEDRSAPSASAERPTLVRTFRFSSPQTHTLWFRALTGDIEQVSTHEFKTGALRLGVPKAHTVLRRRGADGGGQELLLRLEIPQGDSTVTLTYELLQ